MECNRFTVERIMEFEIKRLGKPREGYNRALKVILPATEYRVEFLKNSKMLKDASDIWKKVYVKKDLHPVYVAENTRLPKEYYKLKGKTEYKDKVTFRNGKLSIDNLVVDQNSFFS